ncbi:TIGR02757 family protein [Neptunitalea lumnitzerae]|uniref:TIGR02757 family protein n=1 Tax=Neptunitalea lumnitzerae TaxID=2965509 RepID=A0ABQ5MJX4_9FLAO|nr:TIGR02757 family protein [Neptunitalea sp. Y10]GLB49712.1 TIGR02757 family protein [Neptunitalea sp. Y10]
MTQVPLEPSLLKEFLDEKVTLYNNPDFIETDPIQIPHNFTKKEDIEIAGFLTATIAWGNRKSIITNAKKFMDIMGNDPYDFVMSFSKNDIPKFEGFVHRTFNSIDAAYFIESLQNIYANHNGLENVFAAHIEAQSLQPAITAFKNIFFSIDHPQRTTKHISDPAKNSAAKRINMFLRWMARKDNAGVDFGIWNSIPTSHLSCPLDVHSGNVARKLGLLNRKQNDAKALNLLDEALRKLDPLDPVKYDFALFGLGVFEKL